VIGPTRPAEVEILARGPNVFSGNRNRPEETGKVFDENVWFRTGDLGYVDDGYLYVTGRVSTLIMTPGGKNVQPKAVEQAYWRPLDPEDRRGAKRRPARRGDRT
jgi:long-subunit acyl-CoA synthetase (AMP-forming)